MADPLCIVQTAVYFICPDFAQGFAIRAPTRSLHVLYVLIKYPNSFVDTGSLEKSA